MKDAAAQGLSGYARLQFVVRAGFRLATGRSPTDEGRGLTGFRGARNRRMALDARACMMRLELEEMSVAKVALPETLVDYDEDVLLWSRQQARLLREGRFAQLDIEHLADEIEDVGKSEKRELASRCAVLLAHLLKWRFQPSIRSKSWRTTINLQREQIEMALDETPSLKTVMGDARWRRGVWSDARAQAFKDMRQQRDALPVDPPWSIEEARDPNFWPTA